MYLSCGTGFKKFEGKEKNPIMCHLVCWVEVQVVETQGGQCRMFCSVQNYFRRGDKVSVTTPGVEVYIGCCLGRQWLYSKISLSIQSLVGF